MTHCKKLPPTGDQGQRYEISYWDIEKEKRLIYGWCEIKQIANAIIISINKNPSWRNGEIRDRKAQCTF